MKLRSMKKSLPIIISTLFMASFPTFAEVDVNAGVTSNYIWRGFEQTAGNPAVFAGANWSDTSGWYASGWVSTISGADLEIDLWAGYKFTHNDIDYDVGYIAYYYPGSEGNIDSSEVYAIASYNGLSAGLWVMADHSFYSFGDTVYLDLGYKHALTQDLTASMHVGHSMADFADSDYTDVKFQIDTMGFNAGVTKVFVDGNSNSNVEETKWFVGYTHNF